jgi:hypothetical protein
MLSRENISDRFVVPTVAAAIDRVVHLGVEEIIHRRALGGGSRRA